MKRILYLSIALALSSCVSQSAHDSAISKLHTTIDSLNVIIELNNARIAVLCDSISILSDSISILSYPAEQRLNAIVNHIKANEFDKARYEITQLQQTFPQSIESQQCVSQLAIIEKKEAAIKAEQERLKALGFKVFKDVSSVIIDDRKCTFSQFSFGRRFESDYCPDVDEISYETADKGNTFILASMSMSTKENDAYTPSIYACKISDGKLKEIAYFKHEYASWTSYGAKIGIYSDHSHDFSKVNTVRYCIAAEISNEVSKRPIVIVIPKKDKKYKDGMSVEDANENLHIIRIINRNKL